MFCVIGGHSATSPTKPTASSRSKDEAVNSSASPTQKKIFSSLFESKDQTAQNKETLIPLTNHHGEPALNIPKEMVHDFAKPFKFTLVEKFSHGRPPMAEARIVFAKLELKREVSLGHLDSKHLVIRLHHEGEFNRIWMGEVWYIDSFPMRVFRWTPEIESPIVPVWVSLPSLPLFMFNKQCLFSIGSSIESPMTCDQPTAEISRTSVARICVQVNLLKKIPSRIWLECGDLPGFWQSIEVERLPKY